MNEYQIITGHYTQNVSKLKRKLKVKLYDLWQIIKSKTFFKWFVLKKNICTESKIK